MDINGFYGWFYRCWYNQFDYLFIVVAGYLLGKQVSSAIKTHKGVVMALVGAGDNYSNFQTDASMKLH